MRVRTMSDVIAVECTRQPLLVVLEDAGIGSRLIADGLIADGGTSSRRLVTQRASSMLMTHRASSISTPGRAAPICCHVDISAALSTVAAMVLAPARCMLAQEQRFSLQALGQLLLSHTHTHTTEDAH